MSLPNIPVPVMGAVGVLPCAFGVVSIAPAGFAWTVIVRDGGSTLGWGIALDA